MMHGQANEPQTPLPNIRHLRRRTRGRPRLGVVHCRAGVVDRLVRDTFSVVGVSGWCVIQRSPTAPLRELRIPTSTVGPWRDSQ
jgi:hypothetical protein